MQRTLLAMLTALALVVAAPVMAQTEGEVERTNPNAGSISQDSGLTLTGTVQSWNDDEIVLDTNTGTMHVRIEAATLPPNLQVGDRVSVDYVRTTQGVMLAQQIRPYTVRAEEETTARVDLDDVDDVTEGEVEDAFGVELDQDNDEMLDGDTRGELPATGSELPLVGLLGLLALIGAGVVRKLS
ncbi:MAG TPA: LPXTG cell wall anchor domain-containing protein [Thermoanaerobaculia bacterium]|nr:LPXTG cell wall anchor domain-containing protein [Thermoanaerobaculia bacterium]